MHAELLAPAGNWDAMRAAVENGADAVYFGVEAFNARARAENFHAADLPDIMHYLRARGVKGYLTLNVLIFSDELPAAADILLSASRSGVDAILAQDLGIVRLAAALVPDLPIHASTQMTVTDPNAMALLKTWGIARFVVPREFAVADIARIHGQTEVELEAFVHGALCVAWSGQCLTSESLGGRSANRGECAQACRQPYELLVDGKPKDLGLRRYLLSPQDLAGIEHVPALLAAGVVCFKIEGRLKSAEYVANVTRQYRRALDRALLGEETAITTGEWNSLAQSFSRGLTPGYLLGVNHQTLVAGEFPKSRGLAAGKVVRIAPPYVVVQNCHVPLRPGDGVGFDNGNPKRNEPGGPIYQVRQLSDSEIELGLAHEFRFPDVSPGDRMWKTSDVELNRELRATLEMDTRNLPISLNVTGRLGGPLKVNVTCAHVAFECQSSEFLQAATGSGLNDTLLAEKLGQLGGTRYRLDDLSVDLAEPLALPVSALKRLRRSFVDTLDEHFRHPRIRKENPGALAALRSVDLPAKPTSQSQLSAFCRSEAQVRAACAAGIDRLYVDFEDPRGFRQSVEVARAAGVPVYLATPRIVKPGEEGFFRKLAGYRPDGVLVRNLGGLLHFRQSHPDFDLIGDFSLNCANDLTARALLDLGLSVVTPAYDLNAEQLSGLLRRLPGDRFEIVLHQYMPMFHMEHCVFAAFMSTGKDYRDCGRPCEHHEVELRDHTGAHLPVKADVGCRNTVFNGHAQSGSLYLADFLAHGVRRFRIEFLTEDDSRVRELIDIYRSLLEGTATAKATWSKLRATQRLGVTRGTLEHQ